MKSPKSMMHAVIMFMSLGLTLNVYASCWCNIQGQPTAGCRAGTTCQLSPTKGGGCSGKIKSGTNQGKHYCTN